MSRPGVEPIKARLLAAAWRKWQQTNEALDEAEPEALEAKSPGRPILSS
jgi:hypothetical protein